MARITSFTDIIRLWPTRAMFADAVGVSPGAAQQMQLRDLISPKRWERLIEAAQKIDHPEVTWRLLERLRDQKLRAKPDDKAA